MLALILIICAYSLSMAWLFLGGLDYIVEYIKRTK